MFECDIGPIREHHHIGSGLLEAEHIVGRVLDVEVSVHVVFLSHKAEIPIRNVMSIKPPNTLEHRHLVQTRENEAVSNNPDPNAFFR